MKKELMKSNMKLLLVSFFMLSLFVFSVQRVVAQDSSDNVKTFADGVVSFVTSTIDIATRAGEPLFRPLLGEVTTGGDLFTKVLIFLLVVLVTVAVLSTIPFFSGRPWFQFAVGVIISILGIRFIPPDMIEAIAFPSSVFVASIAIGLPFILYGIVLHNSINSSYLRRIGWVIFGVVLSVLYFYNAAKPFFYIYPLFLFAIAIAFWFDGTIKRFLSIASAQRSEERATSVTRDSIIGEIRLLESALAAAPDAKARARIRREIIAKRDVLKSI